MTTPDPSIEQRLMAEQTEVNSIPDTTERALAQHVLHCQSAAMRGDRGASTELTKANKDLAAYRKARDEAESSGSDGEYFATAAQALPYLQKGFIVHKTKFYKDVADGKVPRKNGIFKSDDLLYYARAAGLRPTTAPDETDKPSFSSFRDDLMREKARETKMKNDEREGTLIQRSLVEQELSARLAFLKRDLTNLGPRVIDTMMEKFSILTKEQGLDLDSFNLLSLVSDLEGYWNKNMASYLDSYARPRGFLPETVYQPAEDTA
jgi:phage terminase Nu1 subunit (DNA packaging protein)